MKRLIAAALFLALALSCAACGQGYSAYTAPNPDPLETAVLFDEPEQAVIRFGGRELELDGGETSALFGAFLQAAAGAEEAGEETLSAETAEALLDQYPSAEFRYERRRSLTAELPLAGGGSYAFSGYEFDALQAVYYAGSLVLRRCVGGACPSEAVLLAVPYREVRSMAGLLREKLGLSGYTEHLALNTDPLEIQNLPDDPDQAAALWKGEEVTLSEEESEAALTALGELLAKVSGESTLRTPVTQDLIWEYLDEHPGLELRFERRRSLTAELPFAGGGSHVFSDYEFDSLLILCFPEFIVFQRGLDGAFDADREFLCFSAAAADLAPLTDLLTGLFS